MKRIISMAVVLVITMAAMLLSGHHENVAKWRKKESSP